MTEEERVDICETIYGKLKKAFNKFYWDKSQTKLVNIETGVNLLEHIQNNTYLNKYNVRNYAKVHKKSVIIKDEDEYLAIYNPNCELILRVNKDIPAYMVKEYVVNEGRLAIYTFGRRTVSHGMLIVILDTVAGKIVETKDNIVRIFDSPDTLTIVELEDDKLVRRDYTR